MRPIINVVLNLAFEFDLWLIKRQIMLSQVTGLSATLGEMLLLMAIHFHSNQLSAIGDLVCQTLGMKIIIRTNSMSRKISHVFTHEIFNEQV
jgi:integrator complex subunit 2